MTYFPQEWLREYIPKEVARVHGIKESDLCLNITAQLHEDLRHVTVDKPSITALTPEIREMVEQLLDDGELISVEWGEEGQRVERLLLHPARSGFIAIDGDIIWTAADEDEDEDEDEILANVNEEENES